MSLVPNARPERIMVDFEKAFMNAFNEVLPDTQIAGCYFHLCLSFNRKINELGLKKIYETNSEIALVLRMVPALAFLPVYRIEEGFNLVMEEIADTLAKLKVADDIAENLEKLLSYFQKTYIRGTSKAALFLPSIWNHHNAACEGLARTNNAVEGWHYGIQSLFTGSHPNIWTFIQKFRQDAALHKFNCLQAVNGQRKKPRKKYQELNSRVQNVVKSFEENSDIIPFLRSMAHMQ